MSKVPLFLLVAGLVSATFLLAHYFGAFKGITEEISAAVTWISGSAITIVFWSLAFWKLMPNGAKKLIARLIRFVPNVPNILKRRAIESELEGAINGALTQFNREGAGFIDHEISISWLNPDDNVRRLFFESDKVFIKLDYTRSPGINLVESILLYCRRSLLPHTQEYVNRPLMRAINLQFVDEILQRQGTSESRAYFMHEVLERETNDSQETLKFFDKLQLLGQHGLFTRIYLPELQEYPTVALRSWPRRRHQQSLLGLLDFLETTVRNRESGTKGALQHIHEGVRIAVVLVGIPNKLLFEGIRPYVRRVAINEQQGARTVYLLGYNEGTNYVEPIAREAQRRGLVENYAIELYDALVRDKVQRHKLARLTMCLGEGSHFLTEHSDTSEWPELEDDNLVA